MADVPAGFETPVFQTVLRKRLMWGAPRLVTVCVLGLGGIAFIWNYWPCFPALGLVQGAAILGTWLDEDWFEISLRVLFFKRHYEA